MKTINTMCLTPHRAHAAAANRVVSYSKQSAGGMINATVSVVGVLNIPKKNKEFGCNNVCGNTVAMRLPVSLVD